jgi:hypothetical protein
MWLYVDGGRYEMKPGSTVKFKTTSKTSSTEGVGLSGIQVIGTAHGSQLVCNGSVPMPETTLTADVNINDYILPVADTSGFAEGDYIAVYHDISNDYGWFWSGQNQNDEGFIVHHISGNNIYVKCRVGIEDTLVRDVAIGQNYAIVNNVRKWQPYFYTYIDDECFDIASIDEANNKIIFSNTATAAHSTGANLYQTGCIQPNKLDTLSGNASVGATYVNISNPLQYNAAEQVSIDGETLTISTVDVYNSRIYFSSPTTKFHSLNAWVRQVNNKSHLTGDKVYKMLERAIMYIPAVTIVAACMNADTGVGPAMASGSHVYKGSWALLPMAPTNNNKQMVVITGVPVA